jgi:hypothetical protein
MPTEVVCRHVHRVTPVIIHPSTPRVIHEGEIPEFMSPLEKQVLVAAKGTAESILLSILCHRYAQQSISPLRIVQAPSR